MESLPLTAEQIRERMYEIRRDLRVDVKEIAVHASRMFDWKNYVRSFPWGSVAAAAVVGYLLVPRKLKVVAPAAETLEAIVREQQKSNPPPPPQQPSPQTTIWKTVLPAVGGLVLRMGVNYATKVGLAMLDDLANGRGGQPAKADRPHSPTVKPTSWSQGASKS